MPLLLSLILGGVSIGGLLLYHLSPYHEALLGSIAIMSSGYLLSVAVESAQKDISRSFATIVLALLAVLPEYAVDFYLAYVGGSKPHYVHYATANMTGANRMLLGLFWPVIGFVSVYLARGRKTVRGKAVLLDRSFMLEVFFLLVATLYSFKLPLTGRIDLFDSVVLVFLFFLYARIALQSHLREEEFEGITRAIVSLKPAVRRAVVFLLFAVAGLYILLSVERFTEGLIETGKLLGINEFLLIQWVAPVSSELPELVVSVLLAMKGRTTTAIGALVSSKVNQWTLLVGTLPIAYSVGKGGLAAMPLDPIQREEIFLTAAQSLFGGVLIADLKLSRSDALMLLLLFWMQWIFPSPHARVLLGWIYVGLSAILVLRDRSRMLTLIRYGKNLFL